MIFQRIDRALKKTGGVYEPEGNLRRDRCRCQTPISSVAPSDYSAISSIVITVDGAQVSSGLDFTLDEVMLVNRQVPEPITLALVGLGLAGFGYQRRKQIKAA